MRQKKQKNRKKKAADEFADITSNSGDFHSTSRARRGTPGRAPSNRPSGERPASRAPAGRQQQSGRSASGREGRAPGRINSIHEEPAITSQGRKRRRTGRQKKKRNNSPATRRARTFLTIAVFFLVLVITVFMGVFLIFKVNTITVTGDKVYADADIIGVCGYEIGDNLFFLSTTDKEQELAKRLPHIEQATIKRKLPGTIEIEIVAAQVVAGVQSGGSYINVDKNGKVLDILDVPPENVMEVVGVTLTNPAVAASAEFENENIGTIFEEIITCIAESDRAQEFTKLDLTDIHNIKLAYQNRIELLLGNAADLTDKVNFFFTVLSQERIKANQSGILDLSLVKDTSKATFTETAGASASGSTGSGDESGADTASPFASNPGRGDDIPDRPYTRGSSGSSDAGDSGGTDTGDNTGGTDGAAGSNYSDDETTNTGAGAADDTYYDDTGGTGNDDGTGDDTGAD